MADTMTVFQQSLPVQVQAKPNKVTKSHMEKVSDLLCQDLDFHNDNDQHTSHSIHSFPAKFPPQLPRKFILSLTQPGDTILDPMMGSGTTILEAFLTERQAVGFDIDPLALLLTQVKVTSLDPEQVLECGRAILNRAKDKVTHSRKDLEKELTKRWEPKTHHFIDYWFALDTQVELLSLLDEIKNISNATLRAFFELAFSAIIITKSGGVSLAFDLAHTRPHKAKIIMDQNGNVLFGEELRDDPSPRLKFLTKTLRSPLQEFEKRLEKNIKGLQTSEQNLLSPTLEFGNAQQLPLEDNYIDLIVTSPPYASNAIDYMRAHKFSLVWLGHLIDDLGTLRGEYVGGESLTGVDFEQLPPKTGSVVAKITTLDGKKGRILHRYYSEMTRSLREMFRVLKPGKTAIVVVGSSIMRGQDTETGECLADIGQSIGFEVPKIGVRQLDRNRRMMPAGSKIDLRSQIQQRMHEEYVIGFVKPG